jgi:hypothetical protein
MAVAAVPLIVDGRGLVAADALLPHVVGTSGGSPRLRLVFLPAAPWQERLGPGRGRRPFRLLGGQGREDRFPLGPGGLRCDVRGVHLKEGNALRGPGR